MTSIPMHFDSRNSRSDSDADVELLRDPGAEGGDVVAGDTAVAAAGVPVTSAEQQLADVGIVLATPSVAELAQHLRPGDTVRQAWLPSWWRSNRTLVGASIVGTFVLVVLLIIMVASPTITVSLYSLMIAAVFPLVGIALFVQRRSMNEPFVVLTQRMFIYYTGVHDVTAISLDRLLSVGERMNWLMLTKELRLTHKPMRNFSPTSISRQAGFKEFFVDGLETHERAAVITALEPFVEDASDDEMGQDV